MPTIAHHFDKVRYTFTVSVPVLFGVLFLVGAMVWQFSPFLSASALRARSELMYTLFYKLPLGSVQVDAASGSARSIPVLLYHGEGSDSDMPSAVFIDQMRALKAAGWQTVTLAQFDQWMQGKTALPEKSFLLTFDDGRKDTYYNADPVMEDLGYTGVMFVITGFSLPADGAKSNFYLDQVELAAMQSSGRWELESHGDQDHRRFSVQSTTDLNRKADTIDDGHFLSNKFWETDAERFETDAEFTERIRNDLAVSKSILEDRFGTSVIAYAYPFNDFGQDTVNFPGSRWIIDGVTPGVYTYAFYQTWEQNGDTFNYRSFGNGPSGEHYMLKRIEPDASWRGADLVRILEEGRAKQLPYEIDTFGGDWVPTWGVISVGKTLSFSAMPSTTGASAFLNGTNGWEDYLFTAQFTRTKGTSVSLLARNRNDRDYVRCAFSDGSVVIQTNAENVQTLVSDPGYDFALLSGSIGIGVNGAQVTCYVGSTAVAQAYVPARFAAEGGIGVSVWNEKMGAARATISHISVRSFSGAAPLREPEETSSAAQTNASQAAAAAASQPSTSTSPGGSISGTPSAGSGAQGWEGDAQTGEEGTAQPQPPSSRNSLRDFLRRFIDAHALPGDSGRIP